MTLVKRSRVVPFSCEQMYEWVNRIEDYEHFLPILPKELFIIVMTMKCKLL